MTKFRPCIDLHEGKVKQIVGGSLTDSGEHLKENFVAAESAGQFAELYKHKKLLGGHVIQLGPGNQAAAKQALSTWPGGLQLGGGVNIDNALSWLEAGASHVIVTSWLFDQHGVFQMDRLRNLSAAIGKDKLVVDLSCRRQGIGWVVAMNRWQTLTDIRVDYAALDKIAQYCDEYLIHAADVEGLCEGVDRELVSYLGKWAGAPMTYAGGVASMQDVELVQQVSNGHVDITVGSALDIFGGSGVIFDELCEWNQRKEM